MSVDLRRIQIIVLTHLGILNYVIIENSVKGIQDVKKKLSQKICGQEVRHCRKPLEH